MYVYIYIYIYIYIVPFRCCPHILNYSHVFARGSERGAGGGQWVAASVAISSLN